jgi:dihydrolipoamide dehydrogenase
MVVGDFAQGVQVVVIGGGTGGYVSAIRAAQLGLEVVLIENEYLGGVCLNWGCIPSKALIHVANLKTQIEHADELGLVTSKPEVNIEKLLAWKTGIVEKLRNGVQSLLSSNNVEVIRGTARFTGERELSVDTDEGVRRFEFEHAVIAVGSSVAQLPGMAFDGKTVIDSTDALEPPDLPERMVVIGAGAVGLELGTVYAKLGTKVTILEGAAELLQMLDAQIPPVMSKALKAHGIELVLNARVKGLEKKESGAVVTYEKDGTEKTIETDRILVAIGRRPNSSDIGLDKTGVKTDNRGFIEVNEKMETSAKNIYAVGDVIPGPMLAHKASYQGKTAAEVIAGEPSAFDGVEVPGVIFSDPEIAYVGLSEQEAKTRGYPVKVGVFPFKALGRALTLGEDTSGFTKIVSDADAGTVLGVHIVGPNASDLISEGALAVASASHIEDLMLTMHPHPTLPESIEEAAEQVEHRAVHIFNPAKK